MIYHTDSNISSYDLLTHDEKDRGINPDQLRKIESEYRKRFLDAAMDIIVQDKLNGDQLPMNYYLQWHDEVFQVRITKHIRKCKCGKPT